MGILHVCCLACTSTTAPCLFSLPTCTLSSCLQSAYLRLVGVIRQVLQMHMEEGDWMPAVTWGLRLLWALVAGPQTLSTLRTR